jgi:hypothetical protein
MGYWNHLAAQNWSNANEGLDAHLILRLRGQTPGTQITKMTMTAAAAAPAPEWRANTVGYIENYQYLGVYLDGVPQLASGNTLPLEQTNLVPVVPANGSLNLDLYVDALEWSHMRAGRIVSLTVETSNGTLTFPNVTL